MISTNKETNEFLEQLNIKEYREYYRCDCPECGTKQSAFIYKNNPEWLRCNRLNNCNFVQKIGNFNDKEITTKESKTRSISPQGTTLLNTALNLFSNQNHESKSYSKELLDRGISSETLSTYNIAEFNMNVRELVDKIPKLRNSFHPSHFSDFYNDYKILIPIYDKTGENLDWILFRSMSENAEPKEISFKLHGNSNDILNLHELTNDKKTILITEGIFDGLSFADTVESGQMVSLIGCKKYKRLLKHIDEHIDELQHKKIIVAFDNDRAGNEYGNEFVKELQDRGINAKRFHLDKYNDVNEFYCKNKEGFISNVLNEGLLLKPNLKNHQNRITINKFEHNNLLATAKVNLNGITINDIRIMKGANGPFVSFYQYKDKKGKYQDVVKIIDKSKYKEFTQFVIDSYSVMNSNGTDMYSGLFSFENSNNEGPEVVQLKRVNYGNKIKAIGNVQIGSVLIKGVKIVKGDKGEAIKLPSKTIQSSDGKKYYKNLILLENETFNKVVTTMIDEYKPVNDFNLHK